MSNLIPQAYRDLKKYLGRQDAFIELQELAFREIIAQSEAHPDSAHAFFDEMSVVWPGSLGTRRAARLISPAKQGERRCRSSAYLGSGRKSL